MRKPFIIAEIGINHNGSLDTAKALIDMAVDCDCDAVKFQKRDVEFVYTKEFLASHRDSPYGNTQGAQKHGIELSDEDYLEINNYCIDKKIDWFASAWDRESQLFLREYNLKYNKVASAMLTNEALLKLITEERKHTFVSTGMSNLEMIDKVVNLFKRHNCPFTLMHCVSTYPCEDEECNLLAIKTLQERYNCNVGYSGHEKGILPSIVAVVFGAVAIERHITLDRTMYGSDQAASLEKRGLELLVRDIRDVKIMLGDGIKKISDKELQIVKKLRYHEREE